MMTLLPPGAGALVPPAAGALLLLLWLVPDLLLEQPAKPAATVATAAMPTKICCFATGLLYLVADFFYLRAQGNRCRVIRDARARASIRSRPYALACSGCSSPLPVV